MKTRYVAAFVLLTNLIHDCSCKPFFWGDDSYITTKEPLHRRLFKKIDHWFKGLIDAHPSSTWHWKEHIYGQTYWKDPAIKNGWLKWTDLPPLAFRYRERNTKNRKPFNWFLFPGQTVETFRPDYLDDNILPATYSDEVKVITPSTMDPDYDLATASFYLRNPEINPWRNRKISLTYPTTKLITSSTMDPDYDLATASFFLRNPELSPWRNKNK